RLRRPGAAAGHRSAAEDRAWDRGVHSQPRRRASRHPSGAHHAQRRRPPHRVGNPPAGPRVGGPLPALPRVAELKCCERVPSRSPTPHQTVNTTNQACIPPPGPSGPFPIRHMVWARKGGKTLARKVLVVAVALAVSVLVVPLGAARAARPAAPAAAAAAAAAATVLCASNAHPILRNPFPAPVPRPPPHSPAPPPPFP